MDPSTPVSDRLRREGRRLTADELLVYLTETRTSTDFMLVLHHAEMKSLSSSFELGYISSDFKDGRDSGKVVLQRVRQLVENERYKV